MNKTEIEIQKVLEEFKDKFSVLCDCTGSSVHDDDCMGCVETNIDTKNMRDFLSQSLNRISELEKEELQDEVSNSLVDCSQYRSDSARFKACRFYNEYLLKFLNRNPKITDHLSSSKKAFKQEGTFDKLPKPHLKEL